MSYPTNAITFNTVISGDTQQNIVEASSGYHVYVLSIAMQQEKDLSNTILYCDSTILAKNYGKDFSQVLTTSECNSKLLYLDKTGNDEAFVSIVYTTTTPIYAPIEIMDIEAVNGFFYGDMVIGSMLFFLVIMAFFGGLWDKIIGVKQKRNMANTFLFNSPEGKGNYID